MTALFFLLPLAWHQQLMFPGPTCKMRTAIGRRSLDSGSQLTRGWARATGSLCCTIWSIMSIFGLVRRPQRRRRDGKKGKKKKNHPTFVFSRFAAGPDCDSDGSGRGRRAPARQLPVHGGAEAHRGARLLVRGGARWLFGVACLTAEARAGTRLLCMRRLP